MVIGLHVQKPPTASVMGRSVGERRLTVLPPQEFRVGWAAGRRCLIRTSRWSCAFPAIHGIADEFCSGIFVAFRPDGADQRGADIG